MPTKIEKTPLFFIGQIAAATGLQKMKHGLTGRLFINRAAALKFALFENGNHPEAVVAVPASSSSTWAPTHSRRELKR